MARRATARGARATKAEAARRSAVPASRRSATPPPVVKAATSSRARRREPAAVVFFGREWAQAVKAAWNAGPGPEIRAKKIPRFWEWIERAKAYVDCRLALAVNGLPGSGGRDCLLLDLEQGRCARARLVTRDQADAVADYVLAGSYADWRELMRGFDTGKAVMYRKLMLEKGEVLEFFKSIYYWTESLACVQRIPTSFSGDGPTTN
jgi:hypothetical protein